MIDLKALKEQLRLLGHDLPDEQVVAILKDMNIDFDDKPPDNSPALPMQGASNLQGAGNDLNKSAQGLPRATGSILDNFQGRAQGQLTSEPLTRTAAASASANFNYGYGYTSPAHGAAPTLDHRKLASRLPPQNIGQGIGHKAGNCRAEDQLASGGYSDDCYDHDSDEEDDPTMSCRFCHTADGQQGATGGSDLSPDVHGTWANRVRVSGQAVGGSAADRGLPNHDHSDLSAHFERATLSESTLQPGDMVGRAAVGTRLSMEARSQRPATAVATKDQQQKAHGLGLGPPQERGACSKFLAGRHTEGCADCDVGPSGTNRYAPQPGNFMQDGRWPPSLPGGPGGVERPAANDPYAAWLRGRGGSGQDPHLADAQLMHGQLSPQASNRSFASRAFSSYSTGSKRGTGAKKVDRVQRYQQLQQEWSQNRFLKQASGASRGTSRKPVNFHSHFASLHAAEEAERQRRLRETRARTKKELGAAVEAPTANRRDELRWQTRMRLREQN